jgi:uncharacterized membrane protein HdeD (DUF308 family)
MSNASFFDMARHRLQSGIAELDRKWGWYLALGVFLILLGSAAATAAVATTVVSVMLLGSILVIGGAGLVVLSFLTGRWSGFLLALGAGVLTAIAGISMLTSPIASAATLTLMVGAILISAGIFRAISSIVMRFPNWGWAVLSGIASIVVGGLLLTSWPVASLYFIGLYIGIDLIFHGISWVAFATRVHSLARDVGTGEREIRRAA